MTRYDYLRSTHRYRLRSFFLRHRDTEVDGDRNAFISHGSRETKEGAKERISSTPRFIDYQYSLQENSSENRQRCWERKT